MSRSVGFVSGAIYTTLSLVGAGTFFAVTVATGDYSWVARIGGSVWVFALSMIVLMPTVTPLVRSRLEG
jgi:type IV secretory pathway TrbD component